MELITRKDKRVQEYFTSLEQIDKEISNLLKDYSPLFNGER